MSKQIEALKLALDALEQWDGTVTDTDWKIDYSKEIAAIREALAERFCDNNCTWLDHHPECDKAEQPAQQEPVAVYVGETWCGSVVRLYEDLPLETPLYTSPQPSKPWVGLTDEERDYIWYTVGNSDAHSDVDGWSGRAVMDAIEAKLKEKNG